jgi:hypothetical protein
VADDRTYATWKTLVDSGRTETKTYGSALHTLFQPLVGSLF